MRNQGTVCGAAYRRCLGVGLTVIALTLCAMVVGTGAASAAGPTCPEGSTYNKQTKMCEQPKEQQCPAGSTLSGDKCVKGVTLVCSPGFTLESDGTCTAPPPDQCPEGTTLSADGTECTGPFTCPEGYEAVDNGYCQSPSGELASGICPEGTQLWREGFDEEWHCEGPARKECPSGSSYNSDADQCEDYPKPTCESPFELNVSTGLCEAPPTIACPTGTTENTSTGLCESAPTKGGGGGGRPPR